MMTKLSACRLATLTMLSAGFPATLSKTSTLFSGQLRSHILVVLFFSSVEAIPFLGGVHRYSTSFKVRKWKKCDRRCVR